MYTIERVNRNSGIVEHMTENMRFRSDMGDRVLLPKQVALYVVRQLILADTDWQFHYYIE